MVRSKVIPIIIILRVKKKSLALVSLGWKVLILEICDGSSTMRTFRHFIHNFYLNSKNINFDHINSRIVLKHM